MTAKLIERLERLERSRTDAGAPPGIPPQIIGAWLRAVAIALGGYPRQRRVPGAPCPDRISDAFARGLGYADHAKMEAGADADPDEGRARIEQAHVAMAARYGAEAYPKPEARAFYMMRSALDEWAGAKASSPHWPHDDDTEHLARTLARFGTEGNARA